MKMQSDPSPKKRRFSIGPAALVTAAFIGPGTVTTCSIAGASFGYALLWGLVFSIIATIVLQEMSARLGIITQNGLGEALRKQFASPLPKFITAFLVISSVAIGNAAYETGNILGASLGLEAIMGNPAGKFNLWGLVIGVFAFVILFIGNYKFLEKALISLVILMSLTFLTTAVIIVPDLDKITRGMFIPSLPKGSVLALIGLIGTTVVPYNLFLHASAVKEKWKDKTGLKEARQDIFFSVILGGLISMAIVVTSAAAFFGTHTSITSAADLAVQLQPLLGSWAKIFMAVGLFAAGISSTITAPLAAAYATSGILGWNRDMKNIRFRLIWMGVLFTGVIFSTVGFKPIEAIMFAQVANGLLLPIVAGYLLWVMNSKKIMGNNSNARWINVIGILVVLVTIGLGLRSILNVLGII